ncbi:ATP-binding protein [Elioraea rosea]|uniref:ATP-binding protein n=1 Tax=Elioraea rosea TaxID=2492390 RepID=UPI001184249A|nr:ATP-binding protein [Elioraea rosea]
MVLRRVLPLRFHIAGTFLLFFGMLAIVLGLVADRVAQGLADRAASTSFLGSADVALQDIRRLEETARAAAEALAANPIAEAEGKPERARQVHALATVLRSVPGVSAAYVGWPDGNFLLLRPVRDDNISRTAPSGAAWIAQWAGPEGPQFDFLDDRLAILEQRQSVSYPLDPRERPWYIEANRRAETVVTSPYAFFTTQEPGVSAARKSPSGAVAGVDVSLWDLSVRLPREAPTPSTLAAIVDARGGVLAYNDGARLRQALEAVAETTNGSANAPLPRADTLGAPVITAVAARWAGENSRYLGTLHAGGRDWLATAVPLQVGGTALLMATPKEDLGKDAGAIRLWLLSVLALVAALTIPLTLYVSRRLAQPVELFAKDVGRIAALDFSAQAPRSVAIAELAILGDGLTALRSSLGSFNAIYDSVIRQSQPDRMLDLVLETLTSATSADGGCAWLAAGDGGKPVEVGLTRRQASGTPTPQPALDEVASRIAQQETVAESTVAAEGGALRVIVAPIHSGSRAFLGGFCLWRTASAGPFSAELRAIVTFSCSVLSSVMERSSLIADRMAAQRQTDLVLNSVADGIHVLDCEGRIIRQNPAARSILGWEDHETTGRQSHPLTHSRKADGSVYPVEDCPIHRTLHDGERRSVEDEVFIRKGGGAVSVEYQCSALRDEGGAIVGAVVSFRDVTERKQAQAALGERIKELRRLYRVLELTLNGSRSIAEICADIAAILPDSVSHPASAVALIRLESDEYRSPSWRPPVATLRSMLRDEEGGIGFVEIGYAASGAWEKDSGSAFLREEKDMLDAVASHVRAMLYRRRITERLMQSERLNAVGQLTGGIAHDFNNLLTVIISNAEVLSERFATDAELGQLTSMTLMAAERAAELTSRLLMFSRRQPMSPQLVDINQQISAIDPLIRRAVNEQIDIRLDLAPGLWPALIDKAQFESALLNLCINARDAMPEGGRLTVQTSNVHLDADDCARHPELSPGPYVMVAVTDNGTGMDEATVQRALEPFFTTKEVGKGSGLGLSMVYGFVKLSDGHIKLHSEPGVGTTVTLYFPKAAGEGDIAFVSDERDAGGGHERILVVEDDDLVRASLVSMLTRLGYRVTFAANGSDALEALARDGDVDLLMTDMVMPGGINGSQLAKAARGMRPGIKVLFTSGYTNSALLPVMGDDDAVFLPKPYRREDLASKLREALAAEGRGPSMA